MDKTQKLIMITLAFITITLLFFILEISEKNREAYELVSCINRALGSGIDSNTAEFVCNKN